MPVIGRDWWLSLAAKGNLLLGITGAMLAFAAFTLGVWSTFQTLQTPPENGPPLPSTLTYAWLLYGIMLLLGITLSATAVVRRNRLRNRLAALHGNQDAMSPAYVTGNAQAAPDISAHALEIVWPTRFIDRPLVAGLRVAITALATLAFPIALALVLAAATKGVNLDSSWASWASWASFSLAFCMGWFWLLGNPWRIFSATFGMAGSIDGSEAGIRWHSILGRSYRVTWTELRLLEVAKDPTHSQSDEAIRFMLYGTRRAFRWRDRIGPDNMAMQSQQLVNLVAAKTGLVPRTGAGSLKRLEGPSRFTSLLSSPAATMQRDQNDPQRRFSAVRYSLVWRNYSPQAHLTAGLAGVLLTAADALAVLWILGAVGVRQFDGVSAALPWFNGIWAFFVLLFGIAGVPLLIGAVRRERPSWLLADSSGLHLHSFGRTRSISWIAITDVCVLSLGRRRFYSVADAHSPIHFGWNARTRPWEGPSPVPDSVPLTPEEMAELVVERIGRER